MAGVVYGGGCGGVLGGCCRVGLVGCLWRWDSGGGRSRGRDMVGCDGMKRVG